MAKCEYNVHKSSSQPSPSKQWRNGREKKTIISHTHKMGERKREGKNKKRVVWREMWLKSKCTLIERITGHHNHQTWSWLLSFGCRCAIWLDFEPIVAASSAKSHCTYIYILHTDTIHTQCEPQRHTMICRCNTKLDTVCVCAKQRGSLHFFVQMHFIVRFEWLHIHIYIHTHLFRT